MTIKVFLHQDRALPGVLIAGDFACPCLGKSDQKMASLKDNPTRDPLKPFGDIPTGTYKIRVIGAALQSKEGIRSYGPEKRFELSPLDGEASKAFANGRWGILIHGGESGNNGTLRVTHGCLRLSNDNISKLLALTEDLSGELTLEVSEIS